MPFVGEQWIENRVAAGIGCSVAVEVVGENPGIRLVVASGDIEQRFADIARESVGRVADDRALGWIGGDKFHLGGCGPD